MLAHNTTSLTQIVCQWSPTELSSLSKTYADNCQPPQLKFPSYHSYKAYFEPLLLAEISAEICAALEKYQRTPLRQPKLRAKREDPGTTIALVLVNRVSKPSALWNVDVECRDRRGPPGCVDSDVVAIWPAETTPLQKALASNTPRPIPKKATLAVVQRVTTRTACKLALLSFPDGNEHGLELEDGEENEHAPPKVRLWNLLRLGSLTTMRREYAALQSIKTSPLMPKILRPHLRSSDDETQPGSATPNATPSMVTMSGKVDKAAPKLSHRQRFHSEYFFTDIIAKKTMLNNSQASAIITASTCRGGFAVIQGPPGTGKTRTLIGLLNVIHMTQYQQYYEALLKQIDPLYGVTKAKEPPKPKKPKPVKSSGIMLKDMMAAITSTVNDAAGVSKMSGVPLTRTAKRPRILICAPSNSAVDEILTRLSRARLFDGRGNDYLPEVARIGAGDRVSESVKHLTAEGLAEAFLDRVSGEEMSREAQKKAQMSFLANWQNKVNAALVQLERLPKRNPNSRETIIELHEKLERMERDLRRLDIAASTTGSRDEKLRKLARTYVEDAQLVFSTLSGAASKILTKDSQSDFYGESDAALFDTVIIDEAAQATETSALIPITLGASRCILVGDPQQLPATVLSSGVAGLAYGQSLLERMCSAGQHIQLLDTQYRMHPAISAFPRRYFYQGRLRDDETVQGDHRAKPYHRDVIRPKLGPYVFLDISEGEERRSKDDRSIFNPAEAELASLIYSKLKKEYANDKLFESESKLHGAVHGFGVVTPYKRQLQELRQSFDRSGIPLSDVEIDTVDSFQGREKDVIVFSCVRTAAYNRGIGFVRDVRRMNVGLTRARCSLIILGSAEALAAGSKDWAELVEDASSRGCLININKVDRCLLPPNVENDAPESDKHEAANHHSQPRAQLSMSKATVKQTSYQPADPRRRAMKRDPMARSQMAASHITQVYQERPPIHSQKIDPRLAAKRGNKHYIRDQQHIPPRLNNREELSPELQSTLDQMTSLLSEAGMQNMEAVKMTLRDHVISGGQLDVETVMAAAFASGSVSEKAPASVNQNGSQSNVTPLAAEEIPNEDIPQTTQAPTSAPSNEIEPPAESTTVDPRMESEQAKELENESVSGVGSKRDFAQTQPQSKKKHETEKRAKKAKKERMLKQKAPPEPSGWDMLFGGPKKDSDTVSKPKEDPSEVVANGDGAETSPENKPVEDPQNSEKLESRDEMASSAKNDGEAPGSPGRRKRWNEKEDSRKRRSGEYEESHRGGHKRARGPRSRHGRDYGSHEYGNGDQWGGPMGYDPNMAYMMNNMNPMMAMQQQMMQQQVYQQQAMQQMAMQQQMQQNPMYQQQMSPEAMAQQQAMMMPMGMGMPPGSGAGPYGGEYDGFSPNSMHNGGHGMGNGSYNNNWRPRGRGRGRGGSYGKRWRGRK